MRLISHHYADHLFGSLTREANLEDFVKSDFTFSKISVPVATLEDNVVSRIELTDHSCDSSWGVVM